MITAMTDRWLPFQLHGNPIAPWPVLTSHPTKDRRLSWPEWQHGTPTNGDTCQY